MDRNQLGPALLWKGAIYTNVHEIRGAIQPQVTAAEWRPAPFTIRGGVQPPATKNRIATKATAFGVNDLIGLKGMTTENPLAPSPGTVYRRDLEAPTLRAKQAQTKTGGTASLSLLGGYASNSPLGYAAAI